MNADKTARVAFEPGRPLVALCGSPLSEEHPHNSCIGPASRIIKRLQQALAQEAQLEPGVLAKPACTFASESLKLEHPCIDFQWLCLHPKLSVCLSEPDHCSGWKR